MSERTRLAAEEFATEDEMRQYIDSLPQHGWRYNGWDRSGDNYVVHIIWEGQQQDQTILADGGYFTEPVPGQPAYGQPSQAPIDAMVAWLVEQVGAQGRQIADLNRNIARLGGRVTGRTPYPPVTIYTPGKSPAPRPWSG